MVAKSHRYTMRISRKTVDKLGVKLYDKVAAVVAETIANCYDADAENVIVKIPLSVWLATVREGKLHDRGFEIVIEDDGHGMTPKEANDYYLVVGKDRRTDPRQGSLSRDKRLDAVPPAWRLLTSTPSQSPRYRRMCHRRMRIHRRQAHARIVDWTPEIAVTRRMPHLHSLP